MEHHPSLSNKRRVAFVELQDEGLEVLSHYTQSAEWQAALIVDPDPESYAARMAQVLGIPVQPDPDLEKLSECDLVIWGNGMQDQFNSFRMTLAASGTDVLRVEDIAQDLQIDLGPRESSAGPIHDSLESRSEDKDAPESETPGSGSPDIETLEITEPDSETLDMDPETGISGPEATGMYMSEPETPSASVLIPDWDSLENDLVQDLDRIMALDESFPDRLGRVTKVLGEAVGADFAHLYLKDPVSHRLELASTPEGVSTSVAKHQSMDRGLFSWIVRAGKSRIMTVGDPGSDREQALGCMVLKTARPDALVVLENFSIPSGDGDRALAFLSSFAEQVEDIFAMEQGVESQDILSGFRMRIADRASQLEDLPDQHRIQPTLEFANQVLASEVAYWIPDKGGKATIAQPQTREAARLVADAWDALGDICDWVREHGSAVWTPTMTDAVSPAAPAPYVGVRERNGNGVLIVLYSPNEKGGPSDQLPEHLLTEILLGICDVLRKDVHAARSQERNPDTDEPPKGEWTDKILTRRELEQRVHEEQVRTQRSGQAFSLVRFGFIQDAEVDEADVEFLAEFLFRTKRAVDFVGEVGPGAFVILSPNTDPDAKGLRDRFAKSWERQNPSHYLNIERCYANPREDGGLRFVAEQEAEEDAA